MNKEQQTPMQVDQTDDNSRQSAPTGSETTSQTAIHDSVNNATNDSANEQMADGEIADKTADETTSSIPKDTADSAVNGGDDSTKADSWKPKKRKPLLKILLLLLILIGVGVALKAWQLPPFSNPVVSTENAYVRGQTTVISPRVSGYVKEVLVKDFDHVKAGDALVKIDPEPYEAKVAQAEAGLAVQNTNTQKVSQSRKTANVNLEARQLAVKNAQTQLRIAEQSFNRINSVKDSEGIAGREYDQAKSAVEQAQMALTQALAQLKVAEQDLLAVDTGSDSADAGIANAAATVDLAKQELGHTVVYAPIDGRLGEISVKTGQMVSAGTQLMSVVPPTTWVIANFKETDLHRISNGQSAVVSVDALAGQQFRATVTHIAPATTAEFSVIRADSGNGNFVKIPQRIAVKLEFDPDQADLARLSPGMSVNTQIDTVGDADESNLSSVGMMKLKIGAWLDGFWGEDQHPQANKQLNDKTQTVPVATESVREPKSSEPKSSESK